MSRLTGGQRMYGDRALLLAAAICLVGLIAAGVGGLLAWRYHRDLTRDRAAVTRDQAPPKVTVRTRPADVAAPVLAGACREAVAGGGGPTLRIAVSAARLADGMARVRISGQLSGVRPGNVYGLLGDVNSPTEPEQVGLSRGRAGPTGIVEFAPRTLTTTVRDYWVLQPYRVGPGSPAARAIITGYFARAQLTAVPPGGSACRP